MHEHYDNQTRRGRPFVRIAILRPRLFAVPPGIRTLCGRPLLRAFHLCAGGAFLQPFVGSAVMGVLGVLPCAISGHRRQSRLCRQQRRGQETLQRPFPRQRTGDTSDNRIRKRHRHGMARMRDPRRCVRLGTRSVRLPPSRRLFAHEQTPPEGLLEAIRRRFAASKHSVTLSCRQAAAELRYTWLSLFHIAMSAPGGDGEICSELKPMSFSSVWRMSSTTAA